VWQGAAAQRSVRTANAPSYQLNTHAQAHIVTYTWSAGAGTDAGEVTERVVGSVRVHNDNALRDMDAALAYWYSAAVTGGRPGAAVGFATANDAMATATSQRGGRHSSAPSMLR